MSAARLRRKATMRSWITRNLAFAFVLSGILVACGADMAYDSAPAGQSVVEEAIEADDESVDYEDSEVAPAVPIADEDAPADDSGDPLAPVGAERRIIKDGTMSILVENVELGVSRIETIAVGAGGYVLETSTDYGRYDGRRATVRLAVPVDRFEETLQRIREVAETVEQESATGTDVTQEYIDLEAQIANLEATRARVREFLDQAQSVEEALNVNARLTEIEGQIAERRGRLRYLAQRSARSTIAVALREPAPEIPPNPTATPAPLPEWSARHTATEAFTTLRVLSRGLASIVIWLGIVGLPLLLPLLVLLWLLGRLWRGWRSRRIQS